MEEDIKNNSLMTSRSEFAKIYVEHFGLIFSNLSIFSFILALSTVFIGVFTAVFTAFWLMFWFVLVILTFGIIFLMVPNYMSFLTKPTEILALFSPETFMQILKYALPAMIVVNILAIVFLSLDKHKKHKGRIIFSSIALPLLIISFIVILIGVIK